MKNTPFLIGCPPPMLCIGEKSVEKFGVQIALFLSGALGCGSGVADRVVDTKLPLVLGLEWAGMNLKTPMS
jgi:hypothetical protein